MGKPSAPSAPDPYTTAQAQYQYGTQAAQYGAGLDDISTVGPTGSSTYTFGSNEYGDPTTTNTTTLSPEEQQILNQSEGIQSGQLGTASTLLGDVNKTAGQGAPSIAPVQYSAGNAGPVATSINTSGVPGIESIQGAEGLEQQGQSTALAGEEAAMQPQQSQETEQLQAQLTNAGIHPGDPAYDNAMASLNSQIGQQDTQAAGAAITAGTGLENTVYGEEANTNQQLFGEAQSEEQAQNSGQSQQYGENLSNANLSNTAGTTALSDWANETGIPLNELSSILSGSQVSAPQSGASTAQSVSAPDIMSAFQNQYAGQLSQYNAGVASNNALYSDAATLGSLAYLALS